MEQCSIVTYDSALGTVLVVDDNAENRAPAKAVLEDEDGAPGAVFCVRITDVA
jgi:CheY-like chemotaxis protein